ncbi:MAG: helix-turn-helix transcriptional regulator [Eubacteriales bacterium]|nr:helix-turn-helix transcriptional regulator [Eubacteriales bacterium]
MSENLAFDYEQDFDNLQDETNSDILDFSPRKSITKVLLAEEAERIGELANGLIEEGTKSEPIFFRYAVCPGFSIEYMFYKGDRQSKISNKHNRNWDFRIDHCLEGCIESYHHPKAKEKELQVSYLNRGQIGINDGSRYYTHYKFPQGVYRGVSIIINTQEMEDVTIKILDQLEINPESIKERYIDESGILLTSDNGDIGKLLYNLYEIEVLEDAAYMQLKAMEIMRLLICGPRLKPISLKTFAPEVIEGLRNKVDSIIMGRAEGDVTLPKLIQESGLGTGEFYELFEQVYGQAPGRFIREYSLRAAHELLTETDLPVKDVARRSGFNTSSKFSTTFKRRFGLSPKDFRQQQLRNN